MRNRYEDAAGAIKNAECTIVVTGAGISTESGIPTFHGTSGIWAKYPIEEYATIEAYDRNPEKVWAFWCELLGDVSECKPNPGHKALAELEEMGLLKAVITQNVDNLHQDAGSQNVIEYHGNARYLKCPRCRHRDKLDLQVHGGSPPFCFCGEIMKPDVVMYGEQIPSEALIGADSLARQCDVVMVVGTSAQVYPAAGIPVAAKEHGAYIIEVNIEETQFTSTITNVFLKGPASEILPQLVEAVKA